MSTPYRDPGFEHKAEYERFLKSRGVTAYIYSGSIKRAAKAINEFLTPVTLSSVADLDRIMELLRPTVKARASFNSIRCALRAYVKMLNSNFDGLFPVSSAAGSPAANDLDFNHCPDRIKQEVYRFIRDTAASREIKALYEYRCQLCGLGLEIAPGELYAEAHHLRPLGGGHKGDDLKENLICVCPNHHAQLDYFAIKLDLGALRLKEHEINPVFVEYHNSKVKV